MDGKAIEDNGFSLACTDAIKGEHTKGLGDEMVRVICVESAVLNMLQYYDNFLAYALLSLLY